MAKPAHKFVIRYRSGAEVHVAADQLSVTWNTAHGQATEVSWRNMEPRPLALGLQNIESVWQVS